MFKNVIVGVDGREGGRDAIALAKVLRDEGGVITLAHVRPGESLVWRGSNPAYEAVEEADSHDLLEHARGGGGRGFHLLACRPVHRPRIARAGR